MKMTIVRDKQGGETLNWTQINADDQDQKTNTTKKFESLRCQIGTSKRMLSIFNSRSDDIICLAGSAKQINVCDRLCGSAVD